MNRSERSSGLIAVTATLSLVACAACSAGRSEWSPRPGVTGAPSSTTVINDTAHSVSYAWCAGHHRITSIACGIPPLRRLTPGTSGILRYGPSADGGDPGGTLVVVTSGGTLRCRELEGAPNRVEGTVAIRRHVTKQQCL